MTFDFECLRCDYTFEIDYHTLSEDPEGLECPNCGLRAELTQVEDLLGAVDDLTTAMANLRRKFSFAVQVETEDLTPEDGIEVLDDDFVDDDLEAEDEEPGWEDPDF